jgi:hypothetical protein
MAGLTGRASKRRVDVTRFEVWKVSRNLLVRHAPGQHSKNVRDTDAHAVRTGRRKGCLPVPLIKAGCLRPRAGS